MIHLLWHYMPYIIFGASMGSSAVHWFRRQFPSNPEPPPKWNRPDKSLQIGDDPLIQTFRAMDAVYTSVRRRTIHRESLILTTTVIAISASVILKWIGDRNA